MEVFPSQIGELSLFNALVSLTVSKPARDHIADESCLSGAASWLRFQLISYSSKSLSGFCIVGWEEGADSASTVG